MCGLCDPSWFTQEGRDRGNVVHMAAECVFTGQDVAVAPAYRGYVEALRNGATALKVVPIWVERRLRMADLTGRPDLVGYVTERVGQIFPGPVIPDVKSGTREPQHGVQLAFYEMLAEACGARALLPPEFRDLPWQRVGFYVDARGCYRLHPYADPDDFTVAHAILDLTRWRLRHGLIRLTDDDDLAEELADGITGDDGAGGGAGSQQPDQKAIRGAGA